MADERWITVRDGQLILVTELDGWAYLRAKERGELYHWESPITLEELGRRFSTNSRLYREALEALAPQENRHGQP